ncbi:MAG: ammonium transporter, partial [Xenococcaceae cyanobacterium]
MNIRQNRQETRPKLDRSNKGGDRYLKPFQTLNKYLSPTWLACIPLVAIIFIVWNTAAVAQYTQDKPLTPQDVQGALNATWVLIAAILVIFMNAGFAML